MSYAPPDFETLRTDLLAAYRGRINGADVSDDSDIYARASVAAAAAVQVSAGAKYVERQIFPDSADTANLVRHAGLYGIERLDPTAAADGEVQLGGTNGTVVASGLTLTHADGTVFVTTSGGTIASSILVVGLDAVTTGTAGNKIVGDALTVQSPPAGVNSAAAVTAELTGGTDEETDAALVARVLNRMRYGNAGGTANDYVQWAEAVDGVLRADCLALRRGPGTVSVAVYTLDGDDNRTPADVTLRTTVLAALNALRPVTADVDVPEVTEVPTDVTVQILEYEDGYNEATVRVAVGVAIAAHIYGLVTAETEYRSRLGRAISAVPGVLDYDLTVPAANVVPALSSTVVEVLTPGTIVVT